AVEGVLIRFEQNLRIVRVRRNAFAARQWTRRDLVESLDAVSDLISRVADQKCAAPLLIARDENRVLDIILRDKLKNACALRRKSGPRVTTVGAKIPDHYRRHNKLEASCRREQLIFEPLKLCGTEHGGSR